HEPDGATTAGYGSNVATNRRASSRACSGYPELACICPQQVCPGGNPTVWPSRSRRRTTARPVAGYIRQLTHVRTSAIRIATSGRTLSMTLGGGRGRGPPEEPSAAGSAAATGGRGSRRRVGRGRVDARGRQVPPVERPPTRLLVRA